MVARARAGEAPAWAILVDTHGPRLHAMLLHLCAGDHEQAAEFTQEAFARAYERLDRFAGQSAFFTWLYRLARNRAIDLLARKRPVATDFSEDLRVSSAPAPVDVLANADLAERVRDALATLPTDTRELLLLREYEGLDYAQIGELLGVPEGTVKSRLNRARAALRARLEGIVSPEDLS